MKIKLDGQEVNKDIEFFGFLHDSDVYKIEIKNNEIIMTIGDYYNQKEEYKLILKYIDGYDDPIDENFVYLFKQNKFKIKGKVLELKDVIKKNMAFELRDIGYMYNEFFIYGTLFNKKKHRYLDYDILFAFSTDEEYDVSQIELITLNK